MSANENMNLHGDEHLYKPPENVWLRAHEVLERYGFDPRPFVDLKEPKLISKLVRVDRHSKRVYLESGAAREGVAVVDHPLAKPKLTSVPTE